MLGVNSVASVPRRLLRLHAPFQSSGRRDLTDAGGYLVAAAVAVRIETRRQTRVPLGATMVWPAAVCPAPARHGWHRADGHKLNHSGR